MIFTLSLKVLPEKLGLLIGKSGSNFKKIIIEIKKTILNKTINITPEEWNSINVFLRFEKGENYIKAIINCNEEHLEIIQNVLYKEVNYFKDNTEHKEYKEHKKFKEYKEFKKYKKKEIEECNILYKIYTNTNIKLYEQNLNILKENIEKIPLVYSVITLNIKENIESNINPIIIGNPINKYIMIYIKIKGNPEIKILNSVTNNYHETTVYKQKLQEKINNFINLNKFKPIYNFNDIEQNKEYRYCKLSQMSHSKRCISV